ncbi:hypothetical protein ACTXT7_004180 [Hymenolepis weldensis]
MSEFHLRYSIVTYGEAENLNILTWVTTRPTKRLLEKGSKELWYQVMIFTVVAVCLTIIAFGVCLVAGCYVFRLKAKAALLRRHQESHYSDMQFVDGGCLGSPGGVTSGNVVTADGLGGSAAMPIYLQRCSNIDYNHTLQRLPSVRSFSMSRPPTSNNLPSDTAQIPTDQPFIFSNGFDHQNDGIAWPTIYRSPAKGWRDFGFETFTRATPISTQSGDLELSVHGDTLPTVNSPEAYTCRNDPYGYLSELHNHLGDPINTSAPPVMNNMLTLRTSTILSPSVIQPVSKSPIEVENGTLDLRKNDFQMALAPPPSEFADFRRNQNASNDALKLEGECQVCYDVAHILQSWVKEEPEGREYLTTNTHWRLFPAIFQHIVDSMIGGQKGAVAYLDYIPVVGLMEKELKDRIGGLLGRITD